MKDDPFKNMKADWFIQLRLNTGEVRKGARFHGTEKQLRAHLRLLNAAGVGGRWEIGDEHVDQAYL